MTTCIFQSFRGATRKVQEKQLPALVEKLVTKLRKAEQADARQASHLFRCGVKMHAGEDPGSCGASSCPTTSRRADPWPVTASSKEKNCQTHEFSSVFFIASG